MTFSLRYVLLVVGMLQVGLATFASVVTNAPLAVTIAVAVVSAVLAVVLAALEKIQTAPTPVQAAIIAGTAAQAGITAAVAFQSSFPEYVQIGLAVVSAMIAFALNQLPDWGEAQNVVKLPEPSSPSSPAPVPHG